MKKRNSKEDIHLDVYKDHSILYYHQHSITFKEGNQSAAAQQRYTKINQELSNGYLNQLYDDCIDADYSSLESQMKQYLIKLVDGVTSEVGRALVGLTFLQLTIKSITPEQSIRLHKGNSRNGGFSWVEGISMRTLDSHYNTPFLREKGLLNVNKDGIMMTRSLAENYPYSRVYKADMRGPIELWINIIDILETNPTNAKVALMYLLSLLINKSKQFETLADSAVSSVHKMTTLGFDDVLHMLIDFFSSTQYSARAFEVVIHSFMQAYISNGFINLSLEPLSQMRSANKKHGNVGDIELKDGGQIYESWDAKYGKTYLYEELDELKDKLLLNPNVSTAGFIVNKGLELKNEILNRQQDVAIETGTEIKLFNFSDWVNFKTQGIEERKLQKLGFDWLVAVVETFARKRLDIAPLDEPCEEWLTDLLKIIAPKDKE